MKRFLTMMLLAASASAMQAQGSQQIVTADPNYNGINGTLSEFSFNGKVQLYKLEMSEDRSSQTIVFLDDNFSRQGTLTVAGVADNYSSKTEAREDVYDESGWLGCIGDWRVVDEDSWTYYDHLRGPYLKDYDQSGYFSTPIYLTQTLFNTDDKYEYLLPVITTSHDIEEKDRDGDGQIDWRRTTTSGKGTGFKIMSETGDILQTVTFDNGFEFYNNISLLKINGKLYLSFDGHVYEGEDKKSAYLIYAIDSSSNSSSVSMKAMSTSSVSARYTLDGRRTNGEKGINIIRMEDGTAKKVFVK